MTLLYFLHEPREAGFPELQALAGDLRAAGVSFDVRNGTGHYYMHSLVAQSYEAHAWLADHALSGLPAFDAVHFAGGGGAGLLRRTRPPAGPGGADGPDDARGLGWRASVAAAGAAGPWCGAAVRGRGGGQLHRA